MTDSPKQSTPPDESDAATARRAACKIVEILNEAGHIAYLAGGCVRDELLNVQPKDFDVATDAEPEKVRDLFRVTRAVGEAFGVVMVRIYGAWAEVATFRTDGAYEDGRHPTDVAFTDAQNDAKRRDFTINGMYFDPLNNKVIDFVGGRDDLQAGLIRAIGDPGERFGEDYLRMLRAVRFAARFDFKIDLATADAIRQHAPKLSRISRERVGMELVIMLGRIGSKNAVGHLVDLNLADTVLDENAGSGGGAIELVQALNAETDYVAILAAWALDRHMILESAASLDQLVAALQLIKPVQIARRWRSALMLSNEHRDGLASALATLAEVAAWFDLPVARRKRLLARRDWPRLELLLGALNAKLNDGAFNWSAFETDMATLINSGVNPKALLSGDDLLAAGMNPGPKFKEILRNVYDAQLEGRVTTSAEALALAQQLGEA